jgi:lipopolysaccharide export LptBFGC system permease protein LptF
VLYRFDGEGVHLTELLRGKLAQQSPRGGITIEDVQGVSGLDHPAEGIRAAKMGSITDDNLPYELFKPQLKPASEYDTYTLSRYLTTISGKDRTSPQFLTFTVTFWRRQIEPFGPLIMWVNGLPLALAFGRRSAVLPLMFAVIIGLTYWLGMNLLAQLGVYGLVSPLVAVSVAPLFFALIGVYFFSNART